MIFIFFWIAKWLFWPWRAGYYSYRDQHRNAEFIPKVRYANGEIKKEPFEQMIIDLKRRN